jgi:hypothetical protein
VDELRRSTDKLEAFMDELEKDSSEWRAAIDGAWRRGVLNLNIQVDGLEVGAHECRRAELVESVARLRNKLDEDDAREVEDEKVRSGHASVEVDW